MPALVIMGRKRAAPTITQLATKQVWLDVRAGSAKDMVSSASMSAATLILQELVEEDPWDDQMGYEASDNSLTASPELVEREDMLQEALEEALRTGVSSRVLMSAQDRLLQDCWLNWEEDLRWAQRGRETV